MYKKYIVYIRYMYLLYKELTVHMCGQGCEEVKNVIF